MLSDHPLYIIDKIICPSSTCQLYFAHDCDIDVLKDFPIVGTLQVYQLLEQSKSTLLFYPAYVTVCDGFQFTRNE